MPQPSKSRQTPRFVFLWWLCTARALVTRRLARGCRLLSNGADWSAGLPGSGSDVFIGTGSDNVILDTSSSVNSLTLGGGPGSSQLTGDGNAHTLTIAGALTVNQSGTLYLSADTVTAGANSTNLGTIDLEYQSSLQVNGDFSNTGTLNAGIGRNSANNVLIVAGILTNSGTINLAAGPYAGGQAFVTVGGLVNTGTMNMTSSNGGESMLTVNGAANNSGQINDPGLEVYDGYGLSVSGNFINSGSIGTSAAHNDSISVGGTFTNTSTGSLSLEAVESTTFGAMVNRGIVSVGNGSTVTVAGSFTNSTGALLDVENSYVSTAERRPFTRATGPTFQGRILRSA
jgi:hypothetical protein